MGATWGRSYTYSSFCSSTASKARCFLPSDRERLLAVIETGFGDFKPFKLLVRNYVAAMKGDQKGDAVQQVV